MGRARRKRGPIAGGTLVGRKLDRNATFRERDGERLCREQMAAGASRRDHDERTGIRHQAVLPAMTTGGSLRLGRGSGIATSAERGRSRVKASNMPMP